ncbi:MAG: M56 family metallopeptidase [Tannerellaceae bacterium]
MDILFSYILKVSILLTLFYLFFKLLLSKETFHQVNRFMVLSLLVSAFVLPFVTISFNDTKHIPSSIGKLSEIINAPTAPEALSEVKQQPPSDNSEQASLPMKADSPDYSYLFVAMMLAVYIAGVLYSILRLLYAIIAIKRTIATGRKTTYQNYTLVVLPRYKAPSCWRKYILISKQDLKESAHEILAHEIAHIEKKHSYDILLSEVVIALQWFNPAAYLLKQELQAIHEYEADLEVLKQGFQSKAYQLLLIKKAVGTSSYTLANSFNHSTLKKRIAMMLKSKSNRWAMMKIGLFIPLTVSMLVVFSPTGNATDVVNNPVVTEPEVSTETLSNNKVNETSILNPLLQSESFANETTTANQSASTQEVCIKSTGEPFLQYVIDQMYATPVLQAADKNIRTRLGFKLDKEGKVIPLDADIMKNGNTADIDYMQALDNVLKNAPALTGKAGKEYHLTYAAYGTKRLVGVGSEYTIFDISKPQSDIKYIQSSPPTLQEIKLEAL